LAAVATVTSMGLYIRKYAPPQGGEKKYQPMSFGKNMKTQRIKKGKM
jgi:hypothetical protein